MKFTERRQWLYDPEVFDKSDTQTALRINREWTVKHSPKPYPKFFEVDRSTCKIDQLWHVPLDDRTMFSRVLDIPAINAFQKQSWRMSKVGMVPFRDDTFTLSNLILQEFDYFPLRGDLVFFNGYRYLIFNVRVDPKAYWQQTNVWTGLVCECIIAPEGDARPVANPGEPVISELLQRRPLPEV